MNSIFLFEAGQGIKRWPAYAAALILVLTGMFCGNKFNLTVGDGIYLNSPYSIGFMTGLLSLSVIFFATVYSGQVLFKDRDVKFDIILFSYPVPKLSYLQGKFYIFFLMTFGSFLFLITGFSIGQNIRTGSEIQPFFNGWHYLYPILIFGFFNSLLVCSFLFSLSFATKRKLLVVVGGLFLYVLYMIVLLFSNSPFMSGSLPQSAETQQLSALADPFGMSSYFFEAKSLSVHEKNRFTVPFSGYLLINRIIFLAVSCIFLLLTYRLFHFSLAPPKKAGSKKRSAGDLPLPVLENQTHILPETVFNNPAAIRATMSFAKTDLTYLFKSITIVAVSLLAVFFTGMEMYAEIEKGTRLPQQYAGSGLMSGVISKNFHFLGMLIVVYFVNDLYWRSHSSGFLLIEKSTFFSKTRLSGHFFSISVLLCFLTVLLITEALTFQLVFQYFHIDWYAYLGILLFNTLPLILFSAFMLLINDCIKKRFAALGISVLAGFTLAGPVSKKLVSYPLLRIFSDFKGTYSDFNGYGSYASAFAERLMFGFGLIAVVWLMNDWLKNKKLHPKKMLCAGMILLMGCFSGTLFMKGYLPENKDSQTAQSAAYEKLFRKYENLPQPDITDVITNIRLYPSKNAYQILGKYTVTNQTDQPIYKILVNFNPDLKLESAVFRTSSESRKIDRSITEIHLQKPLEAGQTSTLDFAISYQWFAVNGHDPSNAVIGNGSFMRISRYYPSFGYRKSNEIEDEYVRKQFSLGKYRGVKKLEAPERMDKDFISLDMTVSTENDQSVAGTGDLVKHFKDGSRNYFRYKAHNIPFRFAVSSAKYAVKTVKYKGIDIHVFYHPGHGENVSHLIKNAELTLDYCSENFGKYPYRSISFAEISSFTEGFAATSYPAAVFMPENKLFHADIRTDCEQDVINELAGHELSHLWWGNSSLDPDDREGAAMLTETLAMYTEMMLYKKMYGKEKMTERLKVHQQIYDDEKGLSENQPLYKVTAENTHISYSKGAVVMVKLSDLLGEDRVNLALKQFLLHNPYPKKPTSLELLKEFYAVTPDPSVRKKIDRLFKTE